MRDNKTAQGDRAISGAEYQKATYRRLLGFLEREKFDERFTIKNLGTKGIDKTLSLSPDIVICDRHTDQVCVYVGVKKSMRERWKTDDRDARLIAEIYPDRPWFQIAGFEDPTWTSEKQTEHCKKIQAQSKFAYLCPADVQEAWNGELLPRLRQTLNKYKKSHNY